MFCENCGAELTGGGKFCPECGTAVTIKVQNQYKKELEMGGQAFAYLPEEKPEKAIDRSAAKAQEYNAFDFDANSTFNQQVPDYGYSSDTIRAAQDELDRPSKAEEYKKTSTDWRDQVDSERFRQQNAQPVEASVPHYADQSYYDRQDRLTHARKKADDFLATYGTQYSDKSYIAAALLAFFLGGFGAHNFYLGYTKKAVIQLILSVLSVLTFGLTGAAAGIWGFVEFILLLVGTINTDGDGKPMKR